MADAQAAAAPGLTDLEERLLTAFRSAAEPVKIEIYRILGLEWEGQARKSSIERKRKHSSDEGETSIAKRARSYDAPLGVGPPDFHNTLSIIEKVDCVVKARSLEPAGTFTTSPDGHVITLSLRGGETGSPSVGLQFKNPGSDDHVVAQFEWHLSSRLMGQWIVQNFEYVLVKNAPNDKSVNHEKVISQLGGDHSLFGSLMCITLRITPDAYVEGFYSQPAFKRMIGAPRYCLNAILNCKKCFNLRIWFLPPRLNSEVYERCLSGMKYLFDQRRAPLAHIQDAHGVRYGEWLAQQTNFTSLPRELRDRIYDLTLSLGRVDWSGMQRKDLRGYENGYFDNDNRGAFALLSTRASTSQIVSEARQFFYKRNRFVLRLHSNEIEDFVSDRDWSTARGHMQEFIVEPEDIRVKSPPKLTRELNLLLGFPLLRTVTILIIQYSGANFQKYELRNALTLIAESCEELHGKLGKGPRFQLNLRCIEDEEGEWYGKAFMVMMECGLDRVKQFCNDLDCTPSGGLRPMDGSLDPGSPIDW